MNRTIKIASIVLIIIFAGTIILSLTRNIWFGKKMEDRRNQRTFNTWKTFKSDQFDFTFRYPLEAMVDISNPAVTDEPKRVRVRLIGPESEPNTEITDGFTFYVRSMQLDENETFSDTANQIFRTETDKREVITPLQQSEVGDQNAYSFSVRSELGDEVMYEIIEGEEATVFVTTSVVSSPQNVDRNYRTIIEEMQISLHSNH